MLLLLMLGAGQADAQTPAGRLAFAVGRVSIETPQGEVRAARRGSTVHSGETVITGAGRAQIRFADDSRISLSRETRFQVEQYAYQTTSDGQASDRSRSFFNLIRGGVRVLTGLIGKRNKSSWQMRTPAATIGIRGTHFRASYIDNVLLVAVGVDPDGLAPQGVQVSNALGSLAAGPGQNIEVGVGAQPRHTDAQPLLTVQGTPPQTSTERAPSSNEARSDDGNGLALESLETQQMASPAADAPAASEVPVVSPRSVTYVGSSATSVGPLVSNHVNAVLDSTTLPTSITSVRDLGSQETLTRTSASVRSLQTGSNWILFALENGDVTSTVSGVTTLPAPNGAIQFAFGERTTSVPAVGVINFNNVLGKLPPTNGTSLDSTGGILPAGLNVTYDASTSQVNVSSMGVQYFADLYTVSGSATLVSDPRGFVFHNAMTATGGTGNCISTCPATVAGAFIGNQNAPMGANIPTGMTMTGVIEESPGKISFGGVLGVTGTSGL
ncbi:MAG: FecR domain-containing protein [Gammaproteobacteria bacterium]|nr:FecR domain-containing protein [Gammaproteobacteria bacterium]